MSASGMKTYSGEWNFKIGLPAKSGVSGITIMIIPNVMGIAVWSPLLDKHYNSTKGDIFLEKFAQEFNYNTIKYTYGSTKESKDDKEK